MDKKVKFQNINYNLNYEDEIRQLKLTLTKKEKELNDLSNKLKSFQNKNEFDKKLITRQLVDNLFINNQKIF